MKTFIITYPTHSDWCNRVAETKKKIFILYASKMEKDFFSFFFSFSARMRAVPIPAAPSFPQDAVEMMVTAFF